MKISPTSLSTILTSFFIFLLLSLSVASHPVSDNDASRLAGILAIVQNDELSIDETQYNRVGDRIVYNGVSYSSKPPTLHVFAGYFIKGAFQIIKPVLADNSVAIYRVSTALANAFPLTIIFILFFVLLHKKLELKYLRSILLSLFLITGTLLFTYSRYLSNHILESACQLILFFILIHNKYNKYILVITGFILSALFAIDITAGVIVIPITILWLFINKKIRTRDLAWIITGGIPLVFTHFYLSYIQFENFLPPQLFPLTYLSYEGSKWIGDLQGFEALDHNILVRLFNYTFGTHGLFLYQPLLLIPFLIKKNWKNSLWIYVALITIGYILFNTIMQKNYAGSAFGPRRFLPLIPIIYYFIIKNLIEYWNGFNPIKKGLVILAFILTAAISWIGYTNPWNNYFVEINSHKIYFPILYTLQNK